MIIGLKSIYIFHVSRLEKSNHETMQASIPNKINILANAFQNGCGVISYLCLITYEVKILFFSRKEGQIKPRISISELQCSESLIERYFGSSSFILYPNEIQ